MPTTEEYWAVDATDLANLAYNVESKGARLNVPPVEGENRTVPQVWGSRWQAKKPADRLVSLSMWVRGMNADGTVPADQVTTFNDNWDALARLFYRPGEQFALTKRWRLSSGLVTATAQAEYAGGLDADPYSQHGATFAVTLRLADPFFYGAEVSADNSLGSPFTVPNPGMVTQHATELVIAGAGTVENTTTGTVLTVTGAGAVTVRTDPWNWSITDAAGDAQGRVSRSGSVNYFPLAVGDNVIATDVDLTVSHSPAYL